MLRIDLILWHIPLLLGLMNATPGSYYPVGDEKKARFALIRADTCFADGKYDSAIFYYNEYFSLSDTSALRSFPEGNKSAEHGKMICLQSLLRLGTCYNLRSMPGKALEVLRAGMKVGTDSGQYQEAIKAMFYYECGNAAMLELDLTGAIRYYQGAMSADLRDSDLMLKINQNLGGIFFFKEDYDNAIEHYQKALLILAYMPAPDALKVTELLINTGSAYVEKMEFGNASAYFSKAEQLLKRIGYADFEQIAWLSLGLGNLFMKMDSLDKAGIHLMNAARYCRADSSARPDQQVALFSGFARFYNKLGIPDSALYFYNEALSALPGSSNCYRFTRAGLWRDIGATLMQQHRWNEALRSYEKAQEILETSTNDPLARPSSNGTISAESLALSRIKGEKACLMYKTGLAEHSDKLIFASFDEFVSTLGSVDLVNRRFGREGSRLLFNESVKDLYYGALEAGFWLCTHGHDELKEQLFITSEKSRSKILLSGFEDQAAKRSSGIPDSLLTRDKSLSGEISLCLRHLLDANDETPEGQSDSYLLYLDHLIELHQCLDSLQVLYENASPVIRKIRQQETAVDPESVQRELDADEALLSYFIGDSSLFVFEVTHFGLNIRRVSVANALAGEVSEFNREIRLADQQKFAKSGHELYSKLILPVKDSLRGARRLIIIPDEALSTIPFEALVTGGNNEGEHSGRFVPDYLVNAFEISYHFSATLWLEARKREMKSQERLSFAGFAPVSFSWLKNDSARTSAKSSFTPLSHSGKEIQDISALISRKGGITREFLGNDATESNFRDNIASSGIIHIATHSIINDQQPSFSALVFSRESDPGSGKADSDGMLYLDEIFNLDMNADLLVLSSCASGSGKITRSEGVLAMTRGFFISGAAEILCTLWNISDRNARNFMVAFYRNLLSGDSYSAALRKSKTQMIHHPETSLPCLWAPYVIIGR